MSSRRDVFSNNTQTIYTSLSIQAYFGNAQFYASPNPLIRSDTTNGQSTLVFTQINATQDAELVVEGIIISIHSLSQGSVLVLG